MKHYLRTFLLILASSLGAAGVLQIAPIAKAAMWQWSTTASSNSTADPSINWAEGMSPSSVNDSARAMMAVIASWRNDLGAITATTGTSTAYVLTSNQGGFVANAAHDGFRIGFIPNVTSAAGPVTINVDAAGAKPLRSRTGTVLSSGVLVAGSKYEASYKSSTDEWLLHNNYATQFEVPLGALFPFTGTTAPNANFVIPIGQCISRTTYATYFAQVGTTFGACDGTTTFGVPDMRGRLPAGFDAMGGVSANRINASGCGVLFGFGTTCGAQTHTLTTAQLPVVTPTGAVSTTTTMLFNGLITNGIEYTTFLQGGGGSRNLLDLSGASGTAPLSASSTSSFTGNSFGSGQEHPILNPLIGVYYILRVL